MSTTVDHLRIDHHVTVRREFTDASGTTMRAGEGGILRELAFDQIRLEIRLGIERKDGRIALLFPLKAKAGPRVGHMREFFNLGDYAPVAGVAPAPREPKARTMIVPATTIETGAPAKPSWWREAHALQDADRLEEAEQAILRGVPHIGAAASIAEMYAQRMRRFQRAGDEPRAAAAFTRAVEWMGTYAGWATSGGEGAALSDERDRFHASLVREFGYDPTETGM